MIIDMVVYYVFFISYYEDHLHFARAFRLQKYIRIKARAVLFGYHWFIFLLDCLQKVAIKQNICSWQGQSFGCSNGVVVRGRLACIFGELYCVICGLGVAAVEWMNTRESVANVAHVCGTSRQSFLTFARKELHALLFHIICIDFCHVSILDNVLTVTLINKHRSLICTLFLAYLWLYRDLSTSRLLRSQLQWQPPWSNFQLWS